MPAAPSPARLKREDCSRTKHDSLFSPWKVLVGPSDWVDHSAGKEGVQRYRTVNLPDNFPGLYELGVARVSDEGVRSKRNGLGVVVVYLGQADNVRARLQQYGRTGSHLDTGNPLASAGKAGTNTLLAGPGLFTEVLSRGYSVMFRCALMGNKQEAEKTEVQLLRVFDYAWNKVQNGACRRDEILLKLELRSHRFSLVSRVRQFKEKMFGEEAGIKINRSGSTDISSGTMKHILPRIRAFVGFRPHLVNSGDYSDGAIDTRQKYISEGKTCDNKQGHRRKSEGYKVKKINVIKQRTVPIRDSDFVCGVMLEDGSSCLEQAMQGKKRCELHKGRRVTVTGRKVSSASYTFQAGIPTVESMPRLTENASKSDKAQQTSGDKSDLFPTTTEESLTQRNSLEAKEMKTEEAPRKDVTYGTTHAESKILDDQPSGRKWFELIKAQQSASSSSLSSMGQEFKTRLTKDAAAICGVVTDDESKILDDQPSGRKWFELIKAQQSASSSSLSSMGQEFKTRLTKDAAAICGVVTDDGYCKMAAFLGSKRCGEHKGIKASGASLWPSICGARASDGSSCKNKPVAGRKRCGLHKGRRACCAATLQIE